MRRREHRNTPTPTVRRQRPVPNGHRIPLRRMRREHRLQLAFSIEVRDARFHAAPSAPVFIHCHFDSRIVEVGRVRLLRAYDSPLLNQFAARKENIVNTALENSEPKAIEPNINSIRIKLRMRPCEMELPQKTTRALRMTWRK